MKRKKYQIFLITIIILLLGKLLLVSENDKGYSYKYILSNKIKSILSNDKKKEFDSTFLPSMKLNYEEKWEGHIKELANLISNADFQKYKKLNKYFPGTLVIDNKLYRVKIKIHGKRPDGHIHKNHISLKVKFNTANNPFNSKKIKLIITHRISTSFDNMKILGNFFSVLHTAGFWYNIKINQKDNYQYLIQIPMGDDFVENYTQIKGLIDFSDAPYNLTSIDTFTTVKFNKNYKKLVFSRLNNLRKDIIEKNTSNVFDYFDKDYISRFMACNLVGGFLGHGFNRENIYILFNKHNSKFYPMITRDNFISPLNEGGDEFEQISSWKHFSRGKYMTVKNELLTFLSSSIELRAAAIKQIKSKSIKDLKNLTKTLNIFEQFSNPKNKIESIFHTEEKKLNYRLSWKIYKSNLILDNFSYLKKRVSENMYSCHNFLSKDSIIVIVKNHSIYPLVISKFNFNIQQKKISSIRLQIISNGQNYLDSLLNLNRSQNINLDLILKNYCIIDQKQQNDNNDFFKIKLLFKGKNKFQSHPYDPSSVILKYTNFIKKDIKPEHYINQKHISFE